MNGLWQLRHLHHLLRPTRLDFLVFLPALPVIHLLLAQCAFIDINVYHLSLSAYNVLGIIHRLG